MRATPLVSLLLAGLLAGCHRETGPQVSCDLIPLTPGNWWRWEDAHWGPWVDSVGAPVILDAREYFPMHGFSFGITSRSIIYLRMNEDCCLVLWDNDDEKIFIDFNAPVMEPSSVELSESNGYLRPYEINIRSKRTPSTYPGGYAANCYLIEITPAGLMDGRYDLLIAPGIGVVRMKGGLNLDQRLVAYTIHGR